MKVRLEPWTPAWAEAYARHREAIGQALAFLEPSIDHIGSTSLGDIAAKPIIDILVGLPGESHLDATIAPMTDAGYCYIGKFTAGMPYRRFFVKLASISATPLPRLIGPDDELAFGRDYETLANIHIIERGSFHWMRHIAFRDYLRAHADVRRAYERRKLEIARMDLADPLEFNRHKEAFIAEHQQHALEWYRATRRS